MKYIFLPFLLLCGCAAFDMMFDASTHYSIELDSYGDDYDIQEKTCYLFFADSLVDQNSLQFRELNRMFVRTMENINYKIMDSIDDASLIILYNFGISDPETEDYVKTVPIWGQTGIRSSRTTANLSVNPYRYSATYTENTTHTPSYGVVGYRTVEGTRTTYLKYINVVAYDLDYFNTHGEDRKVWETFILNQDRYNDLRRVFPVMLLASKDYLGKSSMQKKKLHISENDRRLKPFFGK